MNCGEAIHARYKKLLQRIALLRAYPEYRGVGDINGNSQKVREIRQTLGISHMNISIKSYILQYLDDLKEVSGPFDTALEVVLLNAFYLSTNSDMDGIMEALKLLDNFIIKKIKIPSPTKIDVEHSILEIINKWARYNNKPTVNKDILRHQFPMAKNDELSQPNEIIKTLHPETALAMYAVKTFAHADFRAPLSSYRTLIIAKIGTSKVPCRASIIFMREIVKYIASSMSIFVGFEMEKIRCRASGHDYQFIERDVMAVFHRYFFGISEDEVEDSTIDGQC
ncbi:Protein of unknown function [Pyronema omphalodes CBS 100304]|uniref:Uncharacterized protein n=1 Tax=Pyronema omphalodes (strain CBS 100304) TaxID=1076935 RepID=U4LBW4_PYROM|nr:Protein of unknown function [Pyronema omphalodes CBS 100304]